MTMSYWKGSQNTEDTNDYQRCEWCGNDHEPSQTYINVSTNEYLTVCYNCSKQHYIEGLMIANVIGEIDG